ncbi:sorbitol dehydrogenase-like [Oppia nitens]|uniref:sorbitol dehydrogenase-like n=1 Tax=Oppia nitens TaxID=1686743 RepID=UPI0023DB528C|nr:sorbitol dehydrogenase-like [Oppia nitens]
MSINDNLSLVLHKTGDLRLENKELPIATEPGPNEVLCKTHSCGICGSDISLWKKGGIGQYVINQPQVLGHECSALVVKVGVNVKHLVAGDRVAIEPAVPCRRCNYCKTGIYNHCPMANIQLKGVPPMPGMLCRQFTHPADFCFKLPANITYEEGAMVEPLTVAVQAVRRVKLTIGQSVLICGAGTIGQMCLAVAKAYGAAKVIITDINEFRLNVAKQMGADQTILIDPTKSSTDDGIDDIIHQILGNERGQGVDVTLECTGSENSTQVAINSTRKAGKVGLIGLGPQQVTVPLVTVAIRELDIVGVFTYRNCFPMAIHLLETGKVNIKSLVTHKYRLEQSMDAFNKMIEPDNNAIKIQIQCNKDF